MKKRGQFLIPNTVEESPRKLKSKEKARRTSIIEGTAASASQGFGGRFITPFALALNAKSIHIGILSSFTGLVAPFAELLGSNLMEKRSRKTIVLRFVLLQSLMWIPIAVLAFLFWKNIFQDYLIFALIAIYSLLAIFGRIAIPAWFSWMGDIIPENIRGRYFAKRNRATGTIGLAVALIGAFLLDAFETKGFALIGFMILFSLAFLFRFISLLLFTKQYSPSFKLKKKSYFSFWQFLKRFDNFGKFSVYRASLSFAMVIASPFFAVYMLKELGFSYVTFMAVSLSATAFYLLSVPLAGKFSDRFGNLKLIYVANALLFTYPLFWIFIKSPILLIFLPQLVGGVATAAGTIATNNFFYDSVSPQKRPLCIAYKSILVGVGIFIGALIGGFLIDYISLDTINPFFIAFGVSSFLRLAVGLFFLPKLKEERKVEKLPPQHIDLDHPLKTLNSEIGWFKSIFK